MPPDKSRARYFKLAALLFFAALAASALYIEHRAAGLVSSALTDLLGRPASVSLVEFSPASGITLYGLRIENPPGSPGASLLSVKSINIRPSWKDAARGRIVLNSLSVGSPVLTLEQDEAGVWNFQSILDTLAARKKRRPFTVKGFIARAALVKLPGRDAELALPMLSVKDVSTISTGPFGFEFSANDGRGFAVEGNGTADVLGQKREVSGKFFLKGENLEGYFALPGAVDASGAAVTAEIDAGFDGKTLSAEVGGRLAGVRLEGVKGGKPLDAEFKAKAEYARDEDRLNLQEAELDVPGVMTALISGTVGELSGGAVLEMKVTPSKISLASLSPYLPAGTRLSGKIVPGDVSVKGNLRPLMLAASAEMEIIDASAGFNEMGAGGINGKASVRVDKTGALAAGLGLRLLGGTLKAEAAYKKGGGSAALTGRGLDLAKVAGLPGDVSGVMDFELDGSLGKGGEKPSADFSVRLAGLSAYGGKVAAKGASAEGAAWSGGSGLASKGRVSITGMEAAGRSVEEAGAKYSYSVDTLALGDVSLRAGDAVAGIGSLTARLKGRKIDVGMTGGSASYRDGLSAKGLSARAEVELSGEGGVERAGLWFDGGGGAAYGLDVGGLEAELGYEGERLTLNASASVGGNPLSLKARGVYRAGVGLINPDLSGNIELTNPVAVNGLLGKRGVPVGMAEGTLRASASLSGPDIAGLSGSGTVTLKGVGLDKDGEPLLRGLSGELRPVYAGGVLSVPLTELSFGESFRLGVRAALERGADGWALNAGLSLPRTGLLSVQEGMLEALPPRLKWAEVSGDVSMEADAYIGAAGERYLSGEMELRGAVLDLYDIGLKIGPAYGKVPLGFSIGGPEVKKPSPFREESFERQAYGALVAKYSRRPPGAGLFIYKVKYGFVEISDFALELRPGDGYYEVSWFGFSLFGGRGFGYGMADFNPGRPRQALSLVLSDISLSEICGSVPGIEGYLSGLVDGTVRVLVTGGGFSDVAGAAMFWAKDGPGEDREISKEFIRKLMGKSGGKYMMLGDRDFDTGELDAILRGGDIVFDKLLISNRNFIGMQDLYVTVAPVSNKISIEHLLDVIREVGGRAGQ